MGRRRAPLCAFPKIGVTSFLILLMAGLCLRSAGITLLIKENERARFPLPPSASARTGYSDVFRPLIIIKHRAARGL